ncbi:MAG: methyltransferase domain-containing protein [Rhodocyclaceae bacterium]|nr:methyltransferase domain-containing protein [Rhodocyclaceae bacterium]
MGLYSRFVLPRIIHAVCGMESHMRQRARLVPGAEGRVLEIGSGSGLNFGQYRPERVGHLWALDPSDAMHRLARPRAIGLAFPVEFLGAPAEAIPLERASADTVVVTYSLCSVAEPLAALAEIRRVLKPGGTLLFCEHGAAPDAVVRRWQARINPAWRRLGGGCHLDRDVPGLLRQGGFSTRSLDVGYLSGLRFASFNYLGSAKPLP